MTIENCRQWASFFRESGTKKLHRHRRGSTKKKKNSTSTSTPPAQPTFRVSGELLSSAPPALVWEVLTDYDGAASIFNNVSESRVLGPLSEHRKGEGEGGRESSTAASSSSPLPAPSPSSSSSPRASFLSAPFEPSAIEQHCSWRFLLFGGSFRMTLGVEEGGESRKGSTSSSASASSSSSSDSDSSGATPLLERSLVFSLLEPGFVRAFEGVWSVAVVEDDGDGTEEGWSSSGDSDDTEVSPRKTRRTRTVVKHSLGVTPAVPPPVPVRPVVRKLFQKQVAGLLDDLERELERRMK